MTPMLPNGSVVFVDANAFLFAVTNHPTYGLACAALLDRSQGIANRLRRHPNEVQQLVRPRRVLDEINAARVNILAVVPPIRGAGRGYLAADRLLYNDSLIVVVMRDHGLSVLASYDADFDRVPGLT